MSICKNGDDIAELGLVKLYMVMTGSTEAQARSVFMFVTRENGQNADPEFFAGNSPSSPEPAWNRSSRSESVPSTQWERSAQISAARLPIPEGA
jgi:hypothetical protein